MIFVYQANILFSFAIKEKVEEKEIISIIEGLVEEGIRWFEISLSDGENGMKCIRTSRKYFEGRDVYIGAGTVKCPQESSGP